MLILWLSLIFYYHLYSNKICVTHNGYMNCCRSSCQIGFTVWQASQTVTFHKHWLQIRPSTMTRKDCMTTSFWWCQHFFTKLAKLDSNSKIVWLFIQKHIMVNNNFKGKIKYVVFIEKDLYLKDFIQAMMSSLVLSIYT